MPFQTFLIFKGEFKQLPLILILIYCLLKLTAYACLSLTEQFELYS